jgi:membrane-associated phospholipid phosphatase
MIKVLPLFILLSLMLSFNTVRAQVEPQAGNWKTLVISSGKEMTLPPPPTSSTKEELKVIRQAQNNIDSAVQAQIQHWNSGAPGYRWEDIASSLANQPTVSRLLSLMHVAIYDATITAWDSKYLYNRPRPIKSNADLKSFIPTPDSPSYPCEQAVAAGAAAAIISYVVPAKADSIHALAKQCAQSRIAAGVAYPSDVAAGLELGRRVAEKIIVRAKTDGFGAESKAQFLKSSGKWYSDKPVNPLGGTYKTWVLDSGSQFRPGPPPDCAKGMAELKAFKPNFQSTARAYYWASQDFWTQTLNTKIFEHQINLNPPKAARIYALVSIARYDAAIACFDAKYTYLGLRPDQYDTTYVSLFKRSPAHPSYPSGHATLGSAMATVMSYFFPYDAKYFQEKAVEAGESRFEGGIHFRIDNEVGIELGKKVGDLVVQKAKREGETNLKVARK